MSPSRVGKRDQTVWNVLRHREMILKRDLQGRTERSLAVRTLSDACCVDIERGVDWWGFHTPKSPEEPRVSDDWLPLQFWASLNWLSGVKLEGWNTSCSLKSKSPWDRQGLCQPWWGRVWEVSSNAIVLDPMCPSKSTCQLLWLSRVSLPETNNHRWQFMQKMWAPGNQRVPKSQGFLVEDDWLPLMSPKGQTAHQRTLLRHLHWHLIQQNSRVGTLSIPSMHAEAFAQAWTQCIGTGTSKNHYSFEQRQGSFGRLCNTSHRDAKGRVFCESYPSSSWSAILVLGSECGLSHAECRAIAHARTTLSLRLRSAWGQNYNHMGFCASSTLYHYSFTSDRKDITGRGPPKPIPHDPCSNEQRESVSDRATHWSSGVQLAGFGTATSFYSAALSPNCSVAKSLATEVTSTSPDQPLIFIGRWKVVFLVCQMRWADSRNEIGSHVCHLYEMSPSRVGKRDQTVWNVLRHREMILKRDLQGRTERSLAVRTLSDAWCVDIETGVDWRRFHTPCLVCCFRHPHDHRWHHHVVLFDHHVRRRGSGSSVICLWSHTKLFCVSKLHLSRQKRRGVYAENVSTRKPQSPEESRVSGRRWLAASDESRGTNCASGPFTIFCQNVFFAKMICN